MIVVWLGLLACGGPEPRAASEVTTSTPSPAPASFTNAEVLQAIKRGVQWLSQYEQPVRFDAILAASQIAALHPGPATQRLFQQRLEGLVDTDHPHIRLWNPTHGLPDGFEIDWVATDGERVNVNRVLTEALHCQERGWRAQTTAYVCGPMRDNGGYHTTHGLWALALAQERGCIPATCLSEILDEVESAQPSTLQPTATLDIDLYSERLLTSCLGGRCAGTQKEWVSQLLPLQQADGSWIVPNEPDPIPYADYHSTMVSVWALATWHQAHAL